MRRANSKAAQAKAVVWQQVVALPLAGHLLMSLLALVRSRRNRRSVVDDRQERESVRGMASPNPLSLSKITETEVWSIAPGGYGRQPIREAAGG